MGPSFALRVMRAAAEEACRQARDAGAVGEVVVTVNGQEFRFSEESWTISVGIDEGGEASGYDASRRESFAAWQARAAALISWKQGRSE